MLTYDMPISVSKRMTGAIEVPVDPMTRRPQWSREAKAKAQQIVGNPRQPKLMYNAKYDVGMLAEEGIIVRGPIHEVEFMVKAVKSDLFTYQLKPVAKLMAGIETDDEKELDVAIKKCRPIAKKLGWKIATKKTHGEKPHKADMWLPAALALHHPDLVRKAGMDPARITKLCSFYGKQDAMRTFKVAQVAELGMEEFGTRAAYEMEMELWPTVVEMENTGVEVDVNRMEAMIAKCRAERAKHYAVICKAAGRDDFNPDSPLQMIDLLFKRLKLPVGSKTKKGQAKTGAKEIIRYKANPVVESIFRYRANDSALGDMLEKFQRLGHRTKDRTRIVVHPNFRQMGTVTTRFSVTDPPLQCVTNPDTTNSPAAEFLVDCRSVFVPRKGRRWYCPDYKQLEVIIFASDTGEPVMLDAIRRGEDIHTATTNRIWGGENNPRAIEAACHTLGTTDTRHAREELQKFNWKIADLEVSHDKKRYRKLAKGVTFCKIFGGGVNGAMAFTGLDAHEAKRTLDAYDEAMPDLKRSMREIIKRAERDGYITNSFGVRVSVDRWNSHTAVNYLVQSDAAQLMKMGMRKIAKFIKEHGLAKAVALLMTIHDELVIETTHEVSTKKLLKTFMELMSDHEGRFCVPTPVDMARCLERWSIKEEVPIV